MPFIENLKGMRLALPASQSAVARKAGVDRDTVVRCEYGYSVMDVSCAKIEQAIVEMARALDKRLPPIVINQGGINSAMVGRRKKKVTPST